MVELFKIRELGVCRKKVRVDENTAFSYCELKTGEESRKRGLPSNFILLVLGGSVEVSCDRFENRVLQSDQMILLLRNSSVCIKVLKRTTMYLMYFDKWISTCDQLLFKAYLPDTEKIKYNFLPTAIPQPIVHFLKQLHYLQEQKVDCVHFNRLKHSEFFVLLRNFCPREDLVMFLAPMIGRSIQFREKVQEKCMQLKSGGIMELAGLIGMGRKNFERKFRQEFGTSPAKWMNEEKAKRLYMFLTEPDITIADAMDQFNFNSATHFNRFCLQHFQKTPGAIIREARIPKKGKNRNGKPPAPV